MNSFLIKCIWYSYNFITSNTGLCKYFIILSTNLQLWNYFSTGGKTLIPHVTSITYPIIKPIADSFRTAMCQKHCSPSNVFWHIIIIIQNDDVIIINDVYILTMCIFCREPIKHRAISDSLWSSNVSKLCTYHIVCNNHACTNIHTQVRLLISCTLK